MMVAPPYTPWSAPIWRMLGAHERRRGPRDPGEVSRGACLSIRQGLPHAVRLRTAHRSDDEAACAAAEGGAPAEDRIVQAARRLSPMLTTDSATTRRAHANSDAGRLRRGAERAHRYAHCFQADS